MLWMLLSPGREKMHCARLRVKHSLLCTVIVCGATIFTQIVFQFLLKAEEEHPRKIERISLDPNDDVYNDLSDPILLWWTPFTGEQGATVTCGNARCFVTENRTFRQHTMRKMLVFYGSRVNLTELPLPRGSVSWALLHEESPKNTPALSHAPLLTLFNLSATFSRHSNFPLTLQYLRRAADLTDWRFYVPTRSKDALQQSSGLAPVIYVQSDCSTPSGRDAYIAELMRYIRVDSYGACLHNRDLPDSLLDPMESMLSDEFMAFVARYKFAIAFENAICEDYITEKLWRSLIVGSVPVYLGSPSILDWLPNNFSAVLVRDFASPRELAAHLHRLNSDTVAYEAYLEHKMVGRVTNGRLIDELESREWGVDSDEGRDHFVTHFECFLCRELHQQSPPSIVTWDHYDCPRPVSAITSLPNKTNWWLDIWAEGRCEAITLRRLVDATASRILPAEFFEEIRKSFEKGDC